MIRARPTQLGGVQVLFDDAPAEMFQVDPDHLICVVPRAAAGADHFQLQIVNGSQRSARFVLPIAANSGILTHAFPGLPAAGSVDGMIGNADGSVNDADHPAAPGSVITLYATGIAAGIHRGVVCHRFPHSQRAGRRRVPGADTGATCAKSDAWEAVSVCT
jgi:uncharacterized protein (TIGR03437 family)